MIKLGILGDPSKLELYGDEYYKIFDFFQEDFLFYILGGSDNLEKEKYREMYQKIISLTKNKIFSNVSFFGQKSSDKIVNRIGLFPSSSRHLIKGPSFILAPYPVNSKSLYLKAKAKILTNLYKPVIKQSIVKLAYYPMGGKAAIKTKAKKNTDLMEIEKDFYFLRKNKWFDWFYLEAGSGQNKLNESFIKKILIAQAKSILNLKLNDNFPPSLTEQWKGNKVIVSQSIYGGGIRSKEDIKSILEYESEYNIVPETIVIGNISESNLSKTFEIIEYIAKINKNSKFVKIN